MIKLKSETQPRPPSRRWRGLCFLVLLALVVVGLMVIERWRGQAALATWKRQMEAKGEIFDPRQLWPSPSPQSLEFSNRLAQVMEQLPIGLANYSGLLSAMVQKQPGQDRRGSQEPNPLRSQRAAVSNSWADLDALLSQAQPALDSLRQLMKDPPPDMGYDIMDRLAKDRRIRRTQLPGPGVIGFGRRQ